MLIPIVSEIVKPILYNRWPEPIEEISKEADVIST